jgi:hypothetical protein
VGAAAMTVRLKERITAAPRRCVAMVWVGATAGAGSGGLLTPMVPGCSAHAAGEACTLS